jgi:RND family efflux transporter MFP subunit
VKRSRLLISAFCFLLSALFSCEDERMEPMPATPVRTELARRAAFTPSITLLGVIRAAQSVPLKTPQRGTIRYPAKFANGLATGAQVARGETIATIENDDVNAAQTEAKLEMDAAAADFERAERSYKLGVISSAEHESLRVRASLAKEKYNAAAKRVSTLRLTSPASGTLVVMRVFPPGSVIDLATDLGEVATAGAPLAECAVAASERALLEPGLPVNVTAHGPPEWKGTGRIAEVAAVINESGTSRVVAAIAGHSSPPPGTGVEVAVQLAPRGAVLTVPEDAVVAAADGPALFVAATNEGSSGRFRVKRIPVVTGGRANGRIEITSGLRDGERVVVSGVDALTDDAFASEAKPGKSS